jgi:hypothetical protein
VAVDIEVFFVASNRLVIPINDTPVMMPRILFIVYEECMLWEIFIVVHYEFKISGGFASLIQWYIEWVGGIFLVIDKNFYIMEF